MSRNELIIVVVAVVIVIGAVLAYYLWPSGTSTEAAIPTNGSGGAGYALAADDHTMGNPKAKVVLIEYAAPTCPHCAHFAETVFPQLKQKYIDTGKVYYVFRVFPLHPSDGAAEAMAVCLPKDQYFNFVDLMFRGQQDWDWEYHANDATPFDVHGGLVKMGRIAGISSEQVDSCINNKAVQDHVNKVASDGQTRYSITGTPTFVINGVVHMDVTDWTVMQADLDAQLAAK